MAPTCSYACPRTSDRAPDEPIEDPLPDLDQGITKHLDTLRCNLVTSDNKMCSVRFRQCKSVGTSQWYHCHVGRDSGSKDFIPILNGSERSLCRRLSGCTCNTSLIKKCIRQWCSAAVEVMCHHLIGRVCLVYCAERKARWACMMLWTRLWLWTVFIGWRF